MRLLLLLLLRVLLRLPGVVRVAARRLAAVLVLLRLLLPLLPLHVLLQQLLLRLLHSPPVVNKCFTTKKTLPPCSLSGRPRSPRSGVGDRRSSCSAHCCSVLL